MTQVKSVKLKGCLYAFLAGALWGVTSPAAQYLFERKNIVSEWLVPFRLISAGLLLLIYAGIRGQDITSIWKEKKDACRLVLFGILGMMGMQFTFFSAVQEMDAGTATIFQYLNPAMLILFFAVVHKIMPGRKEILAVMAAVSGIAIVATHGNFSTLSISPKGFVLGMLVAVTTCFYGVLPAPLVKRYSAEAVSAWGMIAGGLVLMAVTRPWRIPVVIDLQVAAAFFIDYYGRNDTALLFLSFIGKVYRLCLCRAVFQRRAGCGYCRSGSVPGYQVYENGYSGVCAGPVYAVYTGNP